MGANVAIATDGDRVYGLSASNTHSVIYHLGMEGDGVEIEHSGASGSYAVGIAIDGSDLWVAGGRSGQQHRCRPR